LQLDLSSSQRQFFFAFRLEHASRILRVPRGAQLDLAHAPPDIFAVVFFHLDIAYARPLPPRFCERIFYRNSPAEFDDHKYCFASWRRFICPRK
jgi:hypothetical protein